MRKIFSYFVLALCLFVSTQMKAETKVAELTIGDGSPEDVTNLWDALQKIRENANTTATIKLVAGAELAPGYVGEEKDALSGLKDRVSLNNGENITINLNGNTMQQSLRFNLVHASITLTGKGTINSTIAQPYNAYGSANAYESYGYCAITIGKDVTLNANGGVCAIALFPNDYLLKVNTGTPYANMHGPAGGTTIDIYGKIYSTKTCISSNGQLNCKEGNIPVVTVHKDAVLTADSKTKGEAGIYGPGYAKYIIEGEVSGATGIYAKAGQWELNDATIIATGDYQTPIANGNGFDSNGDAVVFDSHGSYAGGIQVSISGDTKIESDKGHALQEVVTKGEETTQYIEIASGTFSGDLGAIEVSNLGKDGNVVEVQGGTFTSDVTNFIDQTKGGFFVKSVDENGNEVFVISNTGSESSVSWTSDLLNATADSYVKLTSEVATEVNVNENITCAYLAVEGLDKVIVKKGYTLTVGEVVLGENGVIEVESGAKLLVTGDKGLYSPAPENLILKADADGMATFVFKPTVGSNKSPKATVEYYAANARAMGNSNYCWDIFVSPFATMESIQSNMSSAIQKDGEPGAYVAYQIWNGSEWANTNNTTLPSQVEAFQPIAVSAMSDKEKGYVTFTMTGQLQGNISGAFNLQNKYNFMGNGYIAEMSASQLLADIKEQGDKVEDAVWYWDPMGQTFLPVEKIDEYQIKALDFFILKAKSATPVAFDYEKLIFDANKE